MKLNKAQVNKANISAVTGTFVASFDMNNRYVQYHVDEIRYILYPGGRRNDGMWATYIEDVRAAHYKWPRVLFIPRKE